MLRRLVLTLLVPALLALGVPALALGVGDSVMAEWPENRCWYHGVIREVRGSEFQVHFDDGDSAVLADDKVRADRIRIGHRVWGRWQQGSQTYRGMIVQRDDEKIFIQYDDGDSEWSTMEFICVEAGDL
ncbi:MAG: hypothetical protein AAF666_11090 [Pseudomonadota bacterium]